MFNKYFSQSSNTINIFWITLPYSPIQYFFRLPYSTCEKLILFNRFNVINQYIFHFTKMLY